MAKLRCVVERITCGDKVNVKGCNDPVALVGNLLEVPVGSVLLCDGNWKVDKKIWKPVHRRIMPANIYGIEKYLGGLDFYYTGFKI